MPVHVEGERCSDQCNYTYEKTVVVWEGSCCNPNTEKGYSLTEEGVIFGAVVRPKGYQPPMTAQRRLKAYQWKLLPLIVPAMLINAANPN